MGPQHAWLMVGCLGSGHCINVLLLFEQERFSWRTSSHKNVEIFFFEIFFFSKQKSFLKKKSFFHDPVCQSPEIF
jgi:hypothetical protein